ncbi:hypothetical protein M0R45_004190 [Rubus argutus]|uniref:SUN domain-containing protein n=1 Tax=Rubus argutus TaxID=59490 RepID=A0AAW1YJ50_RUBAR
MAIDYFALARRRRATFVVPLRSDHPSRRDPPSRWLTFLRVHSHWLLLLLMISVLGRLALERSMSKLVEKAIEKHAADGLARVDYAAASWGATVILSPSFREPGRCFPLKGSSAFVVIKLREPIVPGAITLEHVSNNVVDDQSDAPKQCRVSLWLQHDRYDKRNNEFVLGEFSYDVGKSSVQTFDVSKTVASEGDEGIVNMLWRRSSYQILKGLTRRSFFCGRDVVYYSDLMSQVAEGRLDLVGFGYSVCIDSMEF